MLVKPDKTPFVLPLRSSWEIIIQQTPASPFKKKKSGRNWEAQARFHRDFNALSPPKWRLHVWLCQLLICRQYVKVAHVSDFHGHHTKGEQIADKGAPFPFSAVVRTTASISQIISSTSKRFSLKGDCFTPFIKSPTLLMPRGTVSGYFSSCLFCSFHWGLVSKTRLYKEEAKFSSHTHTKKAHKYFWGTVVCVWGWGGGGGKEAVKWIEHLFYYYYSDPIQVL